MKVCSWAVFVFAAAGRSFHLNDGLAVDGYNSTLPYLGASSAQLLGRLSSQIACGLSSRKERGEECAKKGYSRKFVWDVAGLCLEEAMGVRLTESQRVGSPLPQRPSAPRPLAR